MEEEGLHTGLPKAIIGKDVELAARLLRSGKPVGLPTETVYGLAANGLDSQAVSQIFKIKNRPFFDPLILHVASLQQAKQFTLPWPESAEKLAQAFWPGPLTLVLPKTNEVPDLVTSGNDTVAIRIPNHPLALELLSQLPFPLAAPSANPFGYVSPTSALHVFQQLGDQLPYILDGGNCQQGIESTIVACLPNQQPRILRLGSLTVDAIRSVVGSVDESLTQNSNPNAPGQLDQHYSPYCKLIPLEKFPGTTATETATPADIEQINHESEESIGLVLFNRSHAENQSHPSLSNTFLNHHPSPNAKVYYLSDEGNLEQAAQRLFSILRQLDQDQRKLVWFEWAPNEGLGRAINDRLSRAAAKR